jgi:hypothetical protein
LVTIERGNIEEPFVVLLGLKCLRAFNVVESHGIELAIIGLCTCFGAPTKELA